MIFVTQVRVTIVCIVRDTMKGVMRIGATGGGGEG